MIGEAEDPGEESILLLLSRVERSTEEKLQEAQEKQTRAQTLEIATDRQKSFPHLTSGLVELGMRWTVSSNTASTHILCLGGFGTER